MIKMLLWLKASFEDSAGYASYRRLTAFFFTALDGYIVLSGRITTQIMRDVHYSLLAFILLLIGVITTQQLLQFLKKKA